jgi:hypothetical protein
MTYEQAQKILDRVRDGVVYPSGVVDFALQLTGDLDAHETHRSEGMATEIQTQGQSGRGSSSASVVGRYYFGN